MYCKNCGEAMNDNQAICLACGVKKGEGSAYCQNCGSSVGAQAAACLSCGAALKKSGTGVDLEKDKLVLALICFFLGGLGIHNFMLGENKKGVFRIITSLLCFGLGVIFALVDLIKILTDNYVVDAEKLI